MATNSTALAFRSQRLIAGASLVALAWIGSSLRAAEPASASDPFLGAWIGSAGSAIERVEVGIELKRAETGETTLALTLPVANYFALDLPGAVTREGDRLRYESPDFGVALDLTLRAGKLEGTFPDSGSPASFSRPPASAALPVEAAPPPLPELPAPRWQKRIGGQIFATLTAFEGNVYVGTTGGVMNAFRAADGRFLWAFPAGRPIFGAPLATADAIFFACDDGRLHKLNREDGAELWTAELGDERVARVLPHPAVFAWDWQGPTPVLADGVVFVGSGDGALYAIDAATGARRWRFATGGRIRNGAAVDGPRVVVGSADHSVYAVDRASGTLLWKHDTGQEVDSAPAIHDGMVLVGNRGGGLYALRSTTGDRIWKTFFWGSWVESTPIVVDGTIYVGASDLRRVSALDPKDGRVLWRSDVFGWTWGTPLVVGDKLYAGAAGGKPYFLHHVAGLAELDRATGQLLRRTPLAEVAGAHQWGVGSSPVLAGDVVVVSTIEGGLFGYPLK